MVFVENFENVIFKFILEIASDAIIAMYFTL